MKKEQKVKQWKKRNMKAMYDATPRREESPNELSPSSLGFYPTQD